MGEVPGNPFAYDERERQKHRQAEFTVRPRGWPVTVRVVRVMVVPLMIVVVIAASVLFVGRHAKPCYRNALGDGSVRALPRCAPRNRSVRMPPSDRTLTTRLVLSVMCREPVAHGPMGLQLDTKTR